MKIIHMSTIPDNMIALRGQPGYFTSLEYDPLYVSSNEEDLKKFGEAEQVRTLPVEMSRSISPFRDLISVARLWRVFRNLRPTVVHAHSPKGGLLGMIAARIANIPVRIYQIHGFPYMGLTGPKRQLLMWTERVSCFLATEVISVSPSIREVAIEDRISSARKIRIIGHGSANGIDGKGEFNPALFDENELLATRQEFGIDPQATVVTFIGRLANDKGVRDLLQAWDRVKAQSPRAKLLLVGWVDSRDPVPAELLTRARADDSVILAGRRSDIARICGISDIVVLPSYREGFPTVLLEASAMARPTIATQIPGCIDAVVDGETGLLVPLRDTTALANAILQLVENPEIGRKMGAAGRERVLNQFLQEDVWNAYATEYERILMSKGITPPTNNHTKDFRA